MKIAGLKMAQRPLANVDKVYFAPLDKFLRSSNVFVLLFR